MNRPLPEKRLGRGANFFPTFKVPAKTFHYLGASRATTPVRLGDLQLRT